MPYGWASCWEDAATRYGHDPAELYALAKVESSLNPAAENRSHFQHTHSFDIGLLQINSRSLPELARYHIGYQELKDPCTNIMVGAWILADKKRRYGNTWEAIGAWNAACSELKGESCQTARKVFAWKVWKAMYATSSHPAHAKGQRRTS